MKTLIFQTIIAVALCGIVCADQAPQADREAQLAAMFAEHKQLIDEQRYEEALRIARKAHEIAPDEPAVQVMLTLTQLAYNVHRSRENNEKTEWVDTVHRVSINQPTRLTWDLTWEEFVQRRQASQVHQQQQQAESERQILQQLEMPVTLNVDQPLSLEHALILVCARVDIVPHIDWAELREAGVPTDVMITLPPVNAIKAKSVLNTILDLPGLTYVVRNEMLTITSKRRALGEKYPRFHYVGDLIHETPVAQKESSMSGTGDMGGGDAISDGMKMNFTDIQSIIMSVIEPKSWNDGDAFMSFHFATQSLAIRQTEEVHAQIEDLLGQIRKLNDGHQQEEPLAAVVQPQRQRPESERQILRQLEMPISMNADQPMTLEQAANMTCAQVDLVPYIDRWALYEAGVPNNAMVTISPADGIEMKNVLNMILEQHSLGWVVKNEMLVITSKKKLRGEKFPRFYYVGDLLKLKFFSDDGSETRGIAGLIMLAIEPESWKGGDAFMSFHDATQSIAVQHFEDVHTQIEDMLNVIREINEAQQATLVFHEERQNTRPLSLRERTRARATASPASLRQNRIVR